MSDNATTSGTSPTRLDIPALLSELTLEEKSWLLDGNNAWETTGIERVGIPSILLADGPHGLRVQNVITEELGMGGSRPATCFPPAVGLASTWDVDLLNRIGVALGRESRKLGVGVLLGPGINIKRSPLCGRNFEYFSEDPLLTGMLAAALVEGVQAQGVGTSLKHYAANNQEAQRMTVSAEIDERTLREIYLPGFERVVKQAQPWTVMCSYNRINGVYASEDPWLLTDVLRDEWGFDGLVVSDWGAVNVREDALKAGLDLEMPSSGGQGARRIRDAIESGDMTMEQLDTGVARVLRLVDQTIAGQALLRDGKPIPEADFEANHRLAIEAAHASAVLLKNDDSILPIDPNGEGSVAVVGAFATTPRFQGAGSSKVEPTQVDTALDKLRAGLEGSAGQAGAREVVFAPGFELEADAVDDALVEEAVNAARDAAVVVLFLGLPQSSESEGFDRDTMDIPDHQVELLRAVVEVNANTVVVLSNGASVALSGWVEEPKAILEGWLLGQGGGSATADLLLGTRNPSGRLAETIPLRLEHNPSFGAFPGEHDQVVYGEGVLVGYRWYDTRRLEVSYPFGHGLSYTSFAYDALSVSVQDDHDGTAEVTTNVSVAVTNTGSVSGVETVQVYVADPVASVHRPEQELRAFARVSLDPGQTKTVTLELDRRSFAFWHSDRSDWVVEGGAFEIRVGSSSRNIHVSETIELGGDGITPVLRGGSAIKVWYEDAEAGPWLREKVEAGGFAPVLEDPTIGAMIMAMPLERLARIPIFGLDEAGVVDAVRRFSGHES